MDSGKFLLPLGSVNYGSLWCHLILHYCLSCIALYGIFFWSHWQTHGYHSREEEKKNVTFTVCALRQACFLLFLHSVGRTAPTLVKVIFGIISCNIHLLKHNIVDITMATEFTQWMFLRSQGSCCYQLLNYHLFLSLETYLGLSGLA